MVMVLTRPPQRGKTTTVMDWVQRGVLVPGYPGWSRVLVVPTMAMLDLLRRDYWSSMEDFSHRVYGWPEWSHAHGVAETTQVCIDNAEWLFPRIPGHLSVITISGELWQP